jgi:signal transduction histidine kinase
MVHTFRRWLLAGDRLDVAWLVFAIANLGAMAGLIAMDGPHGLETVPFHFIYVSFTILYGFRAWRSGRVLLGITFVAVSTGAMTLVAIHAGREDWAELTEVPLMSLMFLAMVFHVRRRQEATAIAQRLTADLRRTLERRQAFVSDASHELLTPITIGRGHLDLLRRTDAPSDRDIREACTVTLAELDRMDRLINRLLLLESAADPGFVTLAPVAVADFLTELHRRWDGTADRRWLLGKPAAVVIPLDRDRMMLALDAVLENAARHTRPGGVIQIDAVTDGDEVEITIADDGDGIPEEARERVFDRFYRVDRGRNRKVGGAGLGLSIVRAVVEAHGGTVSLRRGAGGGCEVRFRLPRASSTGDQPVAAAADGLDPHSRLELAT